MPLQRVMAETSANEFLEWCEYLDKEDWHRRTKLDYYLAQLTAAVIRTFAKEPDKVHTIDYLLDFVSKDSSEKMPIDLETRTKMAKARWKAIAGLAGPKSKPKPAPKKAAAKKGVLSVCRNS